MRGIIVLSALIAVASGYKVSEEYHAHPPGLSAFVCASRTILQNIMLNA